MSNNQAAATALKAAIKQGAHDPAFWLRFFLSHWFPTPFPPFHLGIIALVTRKVEWLNDYPDAHEFLLNEFKYQADPDDPTSTELPVFQLNADGKIIMVAGQHDNIVVPRGFSKTTLLNGLNLYEVVIDGTIFCVYISKSADHAETQLGNIKIELETNNLLRKAYGNVVPTRADVEKWQADQLQLTNGAILIARGKGGQVRGLNYRARRPNRIVLDDVEDDGSVASPTERKKTENWFYSAVEKAGQRMDGVTEADAWAQQPLRITNLGTLLGADSLIMTLAKDPEVNTVKFGAKLRYDDPDDTRMLWPFKMSYETYTTQRARHQKLGKLAQFTREIDSAIRVADDSIFPAKFIYEPVTRAELAAVGMVLDPAISEDEKADHAALVVVGRREVDGCLFILDEWGGTGKTPREKVDAFFQYYVKWNPTHSGIESVAYQKALIYLMREEMARRRFFFHIQPILQGRDVTKEERIVGLLSPRYSNGYIHHLRPLAGYESNLGDWPNGKKDYADAAAMAMTLMGESAGLVIPEGERGVGEYAPLETTLPPAFRTASNYITHEGRASQRLRSRYPV